MTEDNNFGAEQDVYEIGETIREYDPASEQYKNMLHLVAYDVRDARRLRQVSKICLNYGIRVEYSVFECDLTEDLFKKLWHDLYVAIDPDEDAILAYKICGSCAQRIQSLGAVERPARTLIYMI